MMMLGGMNFGRFSAPVAVAALLLTASGTQVKGQGAGSADPPIWPPSTNWLQEQAPQWSVEGSNTLRLEEYSISGDETTSPFAFEGPQFYDELQFNFFRDMSPWETLRGDFQGLANYSDYRLPEEGLTIERFNLTWEKGDSPVPFRIETGDYFGFFSVRTLQQSLKGLQADVQPIGNYFGEQHSFQLLTGISAPNYRGVDTAADLYIGGSWLIEHPDVGAVIFNGISNRRESDVVAGHDELRQTTFSVAAERSVQLGGQKINMQGEFGRFSGDIDLGAASRMDRVGFGHFFELNGETGTPLTWDFRFERFDDDYRPHGATITPNRRTVELRSAYRFEDGTNLTGRIQKFVDTAQHGNAVETFVYGTTVSGIVPSSLLSSANYRFDAFIQNAEDRARATTDTRTHSLRFDLNKPLDDQMNGRLSLSRISTLNQITDSQTITTQATVGVSRPVEYYGFVGTLSPQLLVRRVTGPGDSKDFGPSMGISLAQGGHSIAGNVSLLNQVRKNALTLGTFDAQVNYNYVSGRHTLGAEAQYQNRNPTGPGQTNSYKIGVFWRYAFSRPARTQTQAAPGFATAATQPGPGRFRIGNLPPGTRFAEVEGLMSAYGIVGGTTLPNVTVYETRVLPDIDQRQRLAIQHQGGRVTKTALIIDFDNTGDGVSSAQTYERVREALIRRYGNPSLTNNQGTITGAFVAAINSNQLIRNTEWRLPSGTLRLGIPRRLDGTVRMEVQYAERFPPARETLWSIRNVR